MEAFVGAIQRCAFMFVCAAVVANDTDLSVSRNRLIDRT